MKQTELAELLEVKPQQIADKKNSTNELTSIITRALLEMPSFMAKPYIDEAKKHYEDVREKNDIRRAKAAIRGKTIGDK